MIYTAKVIGVGTHTDHNGHEWVDVKFQGEEPGGVFGGSLSVISTEESRGSLQVDKQFSIRTGSDGER